MGWFDVVISIEDIRSKYVPEGTNPASSRQKDFLKNLVGFDGVLHNSRSYSTFWGLIDISDLTAKDAWNLCNFLQNRNIASLIHDNLLKILLYRFYHFY